MKIIERLSARLNEYVRFIQYLYIPTSIEKQWARDLQRWPTLETTDGADVLVQVVRDPAFVIKAIYVIRALRESWGGIRINWIFADKPLSRPRGFKQRILHAVHSGARSFRRLRLLIRPLGGRLVAQTWTDWKRVDLYQNADQLWSGLSEKRDLERLKWDGILIGDLVYDTYLRFRPAATVDLKDPYLRDLLQAAIELTEKFKKVFSEKKYRAFVTSYTSYITHGIAVRVALQAGCPVYSAGATNQLIVQPTNEFPFHKRNFHQYPLIFKNLEDRQQALTTGRKIIRDRLAGVIDSATSYMGRSAYSPAGDETLNLPPKTRPRALVMGHDFFDSPHIYGDMLFPDFWEWLVFLFEEAKTSDADFYFKPHPNGLPGNVALVEKLKLENPHIHFLDSKWPNQILAPAFDIAFTVYGTIAHEFSYLGLPVVSAATNPHSAYSFSKTAKSLQDYADWIHNFSTRLWRPNPTEVEEFCYVHNCNTRNAGELFPFHDASNLADAFAGGQVAERLAAIQQAIAETRNGLEFVESSLAPAASERN